MPSPGMDSPLASGVLPDAQQQDLLARYALDQLSGEKRDAVEALLKKSSPARKFLENYRDKLLTGERQRAVSSDRIEVAPGNNLVWKKFGPIAGAALCLGAGALWGISQWSTSEKTVPPSSAGPVGPLSSVDGFPPPRTETVSSSSALLPTITGHPSGEDPASAPALTSKSPASEANLDAPKTLDSTAEMVTGSPVAPPLPGVQRSMINFSHTGLTGFRTVPSEMQEVKQPISVGFFTPQLSLPSGPASSSGELSNSNVLRTNDLVAVDYGVGLASGPPFKLITQVMPSPWNRGCQLILVAVKAVPSGKVERVPTNLAFLVDVSSSMAEPSRLPVLRNALIKFVDQLGVEDRIGMVLYSGASVKLLPSTAGSDRAKLYSAVYSLQTYDGTVNGPALQTAYDVVQAHYLKDAINRVVLVTDGDLNFGLNVQQGLLEYVDRQARDGIGLSLIGMGGDILSEPEWKTLLQLGRGTFSDVSTVAGATQVLSLQTHKLMGAPATDVRVELVVGADQVKNYRLVGYDNHWPTYPVSNAKPGSDSYILSLFEVEPISGDLALHPIEVKVSYRSTNSNQPQVVSATIPEPVRNNEDPVFNFSTIIAKVEDQRKLFAQKKLDQPKNVVVDTPPEPPTVVENNEISSDGKVHQEDVKLLQDKAKSWIEPPSSDSKK